jgi:hypothetical protein
VPRSPATPLLSTPFGFDALYEAARDIGASTAAWPRGATPEELSEWLFAHARDPAVARILARAEIRVRYRGPVPASVELVADSPPRGSSVRIARALRVALGAALTERGLPDAGAVRASRDERGMRFLCDLPTPWMPVVTADGREERAHGFEPAIIDLAGARARIMAWNEAHLPLLTRAFGLACAGDARAFRPASIVSPQRLKRGRRVLRVPELLRGVIARVRLIECERDTGHAGTIASAGRDCLKEMAKLGLHIEAGNILSAVLRFDWVDGGVPTDVTLREGELVCSDPSREDAVRRFLVARRILTAKKPRRDLWSTEPWEASDTETRDWFHGAFDELVADGVLFSSKARAVVHPDAPAAGRRLIAFPIPGEAGRWYGVPHGRRLEARTLGDEDLVTWKLSVLALGRRIARALGLSGNVTVLERRGVVDLGTLAIGPTFVRFFLLLRDPASSPGLADRLRLRASPGHAVVILPEKRRAKLGLPEIPLARTEGPYDGIVREAARALGLTSALDPVMLAPPGTRVVVDRTSRRVWFDGVLLRGLPEPSYRLVEALATRNGAAATTKELSMALSGGKSVEAIRLAKHRLLTAIRVAFAEAGREAPPDAKRIVERVRKGEVRMGLSVFVA